MEIEKRAFVKNLKELKDNLIKIGAKKAKSLHIIDYYLCENKHTDFKTVGMHKVGSYSLRVRKNIHPNSIDWEFNCKILDKEGDHNVFHEIESQVNDGESTIKILKAIGFQIFCILDKKREIYTLGNITCNIEDIKNFKPAIELEIIDNKNISENKKMLDNLLNQLKIKKEDLIEKSITNLYMKEFAFNQNFFK